MVAKIFLFPRLGLDNMGRIGRRYDLPIWRKMGANQRHAKGKGNPFVFPCKQVCKLYKNLTDIEKLDPGPGAVR